MVWAFSLSLAATREITVVFFSSGYLISPSSSALSIAFPLTRLLHIAFLQPHIAMVWAFSLSLAATREITVVFFSSGYLDVSVHRVALHILDMNDWI